MRLQQNQVWKTEDGYLCIVELQRLSVTYKKMEDLIIREGRKFTATKKEFCRLLKGAEMVAPEKD